MSAHLRIAAITDEFSPDIEIACRSMSAIGMTGAELRMVFGKNILDLTDEELDRAYQRLARDGRVLFPEIEVRGEELEGAGLKFLQVEG